MAPSDVERSRVAGGGTPIGAITRGAGTLGAIAACALTIGALTVGCSRGAPDPSTEEGHPGAAAGAERDESDGPSSASPARPEPLLPVGSRLERIGAGEAGKTPGHEGARVGGAIALARFGERRVAFVADEDDDAVHTVDLATGAELAVVRLQGRPAQLVIAGDGRLYVSLRDEQSVAILQPTGRADLSLEEVGRLPTAVEPFGLAVTPDDATLLVTSAWGAELAAFSIRTRARLFAVRLPREPRAVIVSEDGSTAFVSHAVGGQLTRVSLDEGEWTRSAPETGLPERDSVDPAPPMASLSLRGKDYEVHLTCRSSDIHIERTRSVVQGYALGRIGEDILAPMALAYPGGSSPFGEAGGYGLEGGGILPHEVTVAAIRATPARRGSGADGDNARGAPSSRPVLRAREAVWAPAVSRQVVNSDARALLRGQPQCILPRAAAVDPARASLLVTCLGIDAVVEIDGARTPLKSAERGRWYVPAGPVGITIDPDARQAVVWSQFARTLSVIDLGDAGAPRTNQGRPSRRLSLAPAARRHAAGPATNTSAATTTNDAANPNATANTNDAAQLNEAASAEHLRAWKLGRTLFHAVGDGRISSDGRACASCHPDGRDDGLVWSTAHGPRQTPMLAGRIEATGPFGWKGDTRTLADHLGQTFKSLGGKGLGAADRDALILYATSQKAPARARAPLSAEAERGRELFSSPQVGCATCHTQASGVDGSLHDVGSGGSFDTPSLRFVGGTAPYYHDGRHATLREVLVASNGKMGWAGKLSEPDMQALEAFLQSL